ncbi:hypothetical protein Bbelb_128440 [Branchiostoma belcheri]|nr:hypothetical protein Bbelb_128440 [Branchiostoma belcheri]
MDLTPGDGTAPCDVMRKPHGRLMTMNQTTQCLCQQPAFLQYFTTYTSVFEIVCDGKQRTVVTTRAGRLPGNAVILPGGVKRLIRAWRNSNVHGRDTDRLERLSVRGSSGRPPADAVTDVR